MFHLNALLNQAGLLKPATAEDPVAWKAAAWITGGTAAIMLRDPHDAAVVAKDEAMLMEAAGHPGYGIASVITGKTRKMGGLPDAAFVVEMKLGFKVGAGRSGKT